MITRTARVRLKGTPKPGILFSTFLAGITIALALAGCAQTQYDDTIGAKVRRVTTTFDETLVRIGVLVETVRTDRTDRDRQNNWVPEPGVTVTLDGPQGTALSDRTQTGQDGLARFELAENLTQLDGLRPGLYRVRVEGVGQPDDFEVSEAMLASLVATGERRLVETTGPSIGTPRAVVDAKFHPPGRPKDGRDLFVSPPQGGDTIELSITARNVGDGALYRLTGTVEADGPGATLRSITGDPNGRKPWFESTDLEFGKLDPGEGATLFVTIDIPRASQGGPLNAAVVWSEYNGHAPDPTPIDLPSVRPVEKPTVSCSYELSGAAGAIEPSMLVNGQIAELTATVTPRSGDMPNELRLVITAETPDTIEIINAESASPTGESRVQLGPVSFRLKGARGLISVALVDLDLGELWNDHVAVGGE
ncbi:MAG: hypothetical protein AAGI53_00500 [Planctomycetota bacterium]